MRNLLFTIETLKGGGAERVLLNLLKNLDTDKFSLTLFLLSKEGVYVKDLPPHVTVLYLFSDPNQIKSPIYKFLYKAYRWLLVKLFVRFPYALRFFVHIKGHYDVGISFCEGLNSAVLVHDKANFDRLISWIHIDFSKHRANITNDKILHYLKSFESIIFVSEDAKDGFLQVFPELNGCTDLSVVYNPIAIDAIMNVADAKPFNKRRTTLLSVGRLSSQKRFDKLIRVQRMLQDDHIFCDIFIIGEGPEKNNLEKLIKKLRLDDSVKLLGFRDNSYEWINHADILVMTSDYEGLPLVICEAMVLKKAILSTNVTGPRELLEDGKYGLLVDNNDDAIYIGLKELLKNPMLINHYQNVLSNNQGNFIFTSSLSQIEDILSI